MAITGGFFRLEPHVPGVWWRPIEDSGQKAAPWANARSPSSASARSPRTNQRAAPRLRDRLPAVRALLIIDMVVASVLMSMGMMMLPPVMIALPFKLVFFVLVDGWYLVAGSLVRSFGGS
jgi:hypothetical protein